VVCGVLWWCAAEHSFVFPSKRLCPVCIVCVFCLVLKQSELDAQRARTAVLPPLQSVVELTTAFRPPERSGGVAVAPAPAPAPEATTATATAEAAVLAEPVGRALPDGSGRLADGTWWEKKSGIERGKVGCGGWNAVAAAVEC
jgi:hypothetical protein